MFKKRSIKISLVRIRSNLSGEKQLLLRSMTCHLQEKMAAAGEACRKNTESP